MRTHLVSAGVFVSLACVAPFAGADPVMITGGSGRVSTDITGFAMTGPNTSISMTVRGSFSPLEFFPGEAVSFVATVMPEDFSTFGFPVTLNGIDYGNVFLQGRLTFVTDAVMAPPISVDPFTVTVPGTLAGTLTGINSNAGALAPLFTIDLTGHGILSGVFREIGPFEHPDHWFAGIDPAVTIQFDGGAGATPEPASLVLLATGAAGLLARRRRDD
ncbi:MAG TPA: PEP-CTERM sorting domain-containing protein [Vicinamibacterales bacterium]|nr:PEP-CTERM sorting domain-containing protein [Vicinamibacterales bacterium]